MGSGENTIVRESGTVKTTQQNPMVLELDWAASQIAPDSPCSARETFGTQPGSGEVVLCLCVVDVVGVVSGVGVAVVLGVAGVS